MVFYGYSLQRSRLRVKGALGGRNEYGKPGRESTGKPKALGQDKFGYEGMNTKSWRNILSSNYDAEIWALVTPTLLSTLVGPIAASVDAGNLKYYRVLLLQGNKIVCILLVFAV